MWLTLGLFFWLLADVQDASPIHREKMAERAVKHGIPINDYIRRIHDATTNIGTIFVVVAIVLAVLRMF